MTKSWRILLASCWAILAPFAFIWIRHQFIMGLNPFLGAVFVLLSTVIALLLVIIVIRRLINRQSEDRAFTPTMLFAVAMISWLVSGLLKEILMGHSTLYRDTYTAA